MTPQNIQEMKPGFKPTGFRAASYEPLKGSVGWLCPSNIALVKYWGKRKVQIPMNPSLSMTLSRARTSTQMDYQFDPGIRLPEIHFRFEGEPAPEFEKRIRSFIAQAGSHLPAIRHTHLHIESGNTFPHSSGIASSASAMGALALCLVQLQQDIRGAGGRDDMLRMASFIARLGSGSASRSVYPHLALWGSSGEWAGSSDEYAIPVTVFHETFRNMRDTILIVESGQKKVSSTAGHALMETNPFAEIRFTQARNNLNTMKTVLRDGDWDRFIVLIEEEALSLHAMMMTGKPGYLLMQPATLAIIREVREYRMDTGTKLGFTLDAGANVHLLYADEDAEGVEDLISARLIRHCEQGKLIRDQMGNGPEKTGS